MKTQTFIFMLLCAIGIASGFIYFIGFREGRWPNPAHITVAEVTDRIYKIQDMDDRRVCLSKVSVDYDRGRVYTAAEKWFFKDSFFTGPKPSLYVRILLSDGKISIQKIDSAAVLARR